MGLNPRLPIAKQMLQLLHQRADQRAIEILVKLERLLSMHSNARRQDFPTDLYSFLLVDKLRLSSPAEHIKEGSSRCLRARP